MELRSGAGGHVRREVIPEIEPRDNSPNDQSTDPGDSERGEWHFEVSMLIRTTTEMCNTV
jgi:hypothetical protein